MGAVAADGVSTHGGSMKVAVEAMEGCKHRLTVEAPVDVVARAWERAYGRVQKKAQLPGFRRGHLPRTLVKLHFGDDVRREVAEHLIPDVYRDAVTEARLEPVDEPQFTDVRLEEGAPLSFVAVVEVKPRVPPGEYRGVEVRHSPRPVTDAEVEETLAHMREHQAEMRTVERPAARGDQVLVDYTLSIEGRPPTTQRGHAFMVGEGTVLPEIDEAVVGMTAGAERHVEFRFPEDHRREEVRGARGTAAVRVIEVKEKRLPALDDDLAKSLGEFETLDAVRGAIRTQLEAQRAVEDRRRLEEAVVDALLARHEFAVPEAMVMRQVAHQVERAREGLRRQGLDPDRVPWDYAKLAGELRPGSERAVRRALVLESIAEAEGLTPAAEEVEAELEQLAQASQRPVPAIRRMMERSGDLEALELRLRERKTLDLLVSQATVREESQ